MCGIAGIVGPQDPADITRMTDALAHRGPDGAGIYREGPVCLGHRRLSIVDLAGGAQPMRTEDGALAIVYNGEVFNAPQIRRELMAEGVRFATRNSDTEAILRLYERRGEEIIAGLRGLFSFAIHDRTRGRIILARDHTGIKPLYYTTRGGGLAFASELKALLTLDRVRRDLDTQSLRHCLAMQFVPAPATIFSDVRKLPAGCLLCYDIASGRAEIRRYWSLPVNPDPIPSREEWVQALRAKIRESILAWTMSDVPITCSLSGGLDSSLITAVLAESGAKVRTYSLGFTGEGEEEYSELNLAALMAKRYGTEHHEIVLAPEDLLTDLDAMVRHLDEPYGGGLPSWYVYKAIGREHKVALTGTGGDELFGNYGKWLRYEQDDPSRLAAILGQTRETARPELDRAALANPRGFFYHRYMTDAAKARFLSPELAAGSGTNAAHDTEALLESLWRESGCASPRDAVAWIDFRLQLPEEFLLVTDRFSMAHGVEARVPFLDHTLVELAFRVPASLRTSPQDPKSLLREAARGLLPEELLRAPKRGFILPLEQWTRGRLAEPIARLLRPEALRRQGLFAPALWDELVAPHLAGKADRTYQVWTLFMFQKWYECYA
ncbi:MAG: asparagine synthase (glutamine-hydrolyzing) [Desulfovibrionaceae bacterium CG1_02_65_16]|nr:MAG: asparagine synthase (glutamine-hydrolyzing) [Desulfovibrionaceae bacterium CG1_02_65_16]